MSGGALGPWGPWADTSALTSSAVASRSAARVVRLALSMFPPDCECSSNRTCSRRPSPCRAGGGSPLRGVWQLQEIRCRQVVPDEVLRILDLGGDVHTLIYC